MSKNEVFYLEKSGLIESVKKLLLDDDFKTICIDGTWGSGKTYFCDKLKTALNQTPTDPYVISFNCFEEDYLANPLLSLLSVIYEYFTDINEADKLKNTIKLVASTVFDIGVKKVLGVENASKKLRGEEIDNGLMKAFLERKKKLDQLRADLRKVTEHKNLSLS